MPWIEIHGLAEDESAKLKVKIIDAIESGAPDLSPKIFIDECFSRCTNVKGENRPHIRILGVNTKPINQLVKVLLPLEIRMSALILWNYYSVKK